MRAAWICLVMVASATAPSFAQVFDTPAEAEKDPDFFLQGEYVDDARGLQAIALGDGEFDVVIYEGGLPGAGWNENGKQKLEVDADELQSVVKQFKRVERASPTLNAKPGSGAVVLFDGTKESLERHWRPGARITDDGLLQQGCTTTDTFGDYSMHLEFRLPYMPLARGQQRGNSGLYHQGRYETQILDSFGLEGKNNEAGGIYSVRDPDLNMCLPPMVWQTYDVNFTAARFDDAGKKVANARATVKLNGVVVQQDVEIPRNTTAAPVREGPEEGPIYLQDHGNPVRFRNIWVRPRDVNAETRRPIVPAFERFHSDGADLLAGGRLLVGELNCNACHAEDSPGSPLVQNKQAPVLDQVGKRLRPEWMIRYLTNPHSVKPGTTMPDVMSGMSRAEREEAATALTNFLVGDDTIKVAGKGGKTGIGERLFHESGCVACHLPRKGGNASADTSVPLVGLDEKYSRASLEAFFKDPLAVRRSGRMPKIDLGGDNWLHVAQYLTGDESVAFGDQRDLPEKPNMRFDAYHISVSELPDLSTLEPDLTGVSRGLDIGVGQRDEDVVIRFSGFLPITKAGKYSFQLSSDDGSRLLINGKEIINNDGVHGVVAVDATLPLSVGAHEIVVEFFEKSGGEELSLLWAGPGIDSGHIDKSIVMSRDAKAIPDDPVAVAVAVAVAVDPDAFVFDDSLVARGRELFGTLGCASCHARDDAGGTTPARSSVASLGSVDPSRGCLAKQVAPGVPNFDLVDVQREAIAMAIADRESTANLSPAAQLIQTMKAMNCVACHRRDGMGGAESDRDRTFVSSIPEMGDEGRLAPPLDGVGDKLKSQAIRDVVSNGDKSRPYMQTYMPGFGEANVGHLAGIFESLDAVNGSASVESLSEPAHRQVATGRQLVGSKGLSCISCHTFGKFKSTGIQAIGLDTMASRIREDWFHRYMREPQRYRPGTRMPTGYPGGKSTVTNIYDGDPTRQLAAIWSFLEKGNQGGVPEGIVSGMIELKPEAKPIIYRNFIEGVSPRGIAVGYPEKVNLCWDAESMSLALIWQDRFIDASKHWIGRGQGKQTPLGGSAMKWEPVSPVAMLSTVDDAWPADPANDRAYRFLGYRLDAAGRPTFRYRTDTAVVEDQPVPVEGGIVGSFERKLQIAPIDSSAPVGGSPSGGSVYFRAAAGEIEPLADGWYLIDQGIRIRVESTSGKPFLRSAGEHSELLVPIDGPTGVTQEIVW